MTEFKLVGSVKKGCEFFYIASHLHNDDKSLLYVGRDDREIFNIKKKIKWLAPNVNALIYQSWDQIPYDKVSPSKEIQAERIKTLFDLKKLKNKTVVLTSINALIQKTLNYDFLSKYFVNIKQGEEIRFDKLIKNLILLGYQRTSIVRNKSDFSVRGSIIDIFIPEKINPIRVDFIGDIIDSIQLLDVFLSYHIEGLIKVKSMDMVRSILDEEKSII